MKKILLPFIALMLLLQSCGSDKKKAFNFNQTLSGISKTLNSKGVTMGAELKSALNSNNYSSFNTMNEDLGKYIDEQIEVVEKTENVSGAEKFKESMIDFLKFEKVMVTDAFRPVGKLDANSTPEEKQAAIDNLMEKAKEESTYLTKLQRVQKEFADKNGFKVEEEK